MAFPVVACGNDTDILNFANGLRYKLCGKYNGTQSLTFLIVCIFILTTIQVIHSIFRQIFTQENRKKQNYFICTIPNLSYKIG